MKYFSILILSLFANLAQGQTDEQQKYYLGFSFSPNLCYRTIANTSNDSTLSIDALIKSRNENETVKPGYTTGIDFGYNLNPSMSIELGVHYSNIGYQSKTTEARIFAPDPSIPEKFKFKYHYHYMDIPLRFNYNFNENKFQFFGSVGLTTNIFQKEMSVSIGYFSNHTERYRSETQYAYNRIILSPTVSAGINYPLGSRFKLRIEPTFRFGALSISNAPVATHLYSLGLNTGIYCKL